MLEAGVRARLLDVARDAICRHMAGHGSVALSPQDGPGLLGEPGASFVTVTVNSALRGCIGSIVPSRPLVEDVWRNARNAAFEDPRFAALETAEMTGAALEISVLGPLEPVTVTSEAELLATLQPGVDGLLLRFGSQRATFLPKVWDTLPAPAAFVSHLKRKMGQSDDFWDDALVVERYRTEEFAGPLLT